jgi:hypothetical protein
MQLMSFRQGCAGRDVLERSGSDIAAEVLMTITRDRRSGIL